MGAVEGDWLVARTQDAGRGRQGRKWVSQDGNFFGSALVRVRPRDPSAPTLSLAASLALLEAVDIAVPGSRLMLKWPNDLLLDGGKLAGILLERSGERVAVGIGVNLAVAPAIEGRATASLDGTIPPQAFAPLLAASFGRWLERWRNSSASELADAWLQRAHPIGTVIMVHLDPENMVSGRFEGLDEDGSMLLHTDRGVIETIRAGDVSLI